jgi:hypothetical protein
MSEPVSRRVFLASAAAAPFAPAADLAPADRSFLEDLSKRTFRFFTEQADPATGQVRDRARTDGKVERENNRDTASIASTGFGLTGLCIAAEHGWAPKAAARDQVLKTLRFFRDKAPREHGWFYHFMAASTGERRWKCELSSIDTALLLAGVLNARQFFKEEKEIASAADEIYGRVDFKWMLNGHPHLLSMGWKPESGFLDARWKHYCELMLLYVLAIGAPANALPVESWFAWERPPIEYSGYKYIYGDRPLFVHQFAHAWVDFRGRTEPRTKINWFDNSVTATRAHRQYCVDLGKTKFPGCYHENLWGITASDSAKGYVAWGGPPLDAQVDGTVVPCAAAGSLMFTPAETIAALRTMKDKFGSRIYGHYGFADAFHPVNGWVNPDVIGIDLGITLLSAENLLTGNVWKWFSQDENIRRAMDRIGLKRA